MTPDEIRQLREQQLRLSRPELSRFLGVSEASLVRWEGQGGSQPRGIPMMLLRALADALTRRSAEEVRQWVRTASIEHRWAITQVLNA